MVYRSNRHAARDNLGPANIGLYTLRRLLPKASPRTTGILYSPYGLDLETNRDYLGSSSVWNRQGQVLGPRRWSRDSNP